MGFARSLRGLVVRLALAAMCLLAVAASSPEDPAAALPVSRTPPAPLDHAGRWITDATGRVIIVRGVNMVSKLPPYTPAFAGFGEDDAALLAREGFNAVRVGVIYSALEPAPGLYDDAYLDSIQETVALLHRYGIMSLIDFHQDAWGPAFVAEGFPGWATLTDGLPIRPLAGFPEIYILVPALQRAFDNFWANRAGPGDVGIQDRFAAAWAHAAGRLASTPGILGWELLNEPFPGTHWQKCVEHPYCPEQNRVLTDFAQRVLNAIRTADRDHIVWYEPWITFDFGFPTSVGELDDPRVGFAFHNYVNPDGPQLPYQHAEALSARTGDALLATEFGATNDAAALRQMMHNADAAMMPVIYWAYWNRTPFAITGENVPPGTPHNGSSQGIVYDLTLPLAGDNVSQAMLNALVRPYPRAVAGTPVRWSFDPDSRIFDFVYQTHPPDGATPLPLGAETEVFVPRRHYRHGYCPAVTGARVVSPARDPILRLANKPRASQVTVRITPCSF